VSAENNSNSKGRVNFTMNRDSLVRENGDHVQENIYVQTGTVAFDVAGAASNSVSITVLGPRVSGL